MGWITKGWELSAGASRTVIADILLLGRGIIESSEPSGEMLSFIVEYGLQRLEEKSSFNQNPI